MTTGGGLEFGVYPLGVAGTPQGSSPVPADHQRTQPLLYGRRQALRLIRTVHGLRHELNISHYVRFGLRNADSSKADLFHQFGIMRDDYSPRPAYATFRSLIEELAG